MARRGINPNRDTASPRAVGTEWASEAGLAEAERIRDSAMATTLALEETLSPREAERRREVPVTDTSAANPRKARALPPPDAERRMLSSNMQKALNKSKVGWADSLPRTRRAAVSRTVGNPERLGGINAALHSTVGMKSDLPPAVQRRVGEIDRSISEFERTNDREHIVYAVLQAPVDHGSSRAALRDSLERQAARGEDARPLPFDGYIPATHSLGNIQDGNDIVMEIRTRSGAYVGSSDTTPNSDHIIGRGRVLRPVGVHEVSFVRDDGTRGTRRVVQMDDITPTTSDIRSTEGR